MPQWIAYAIYAVLGYGLYNLAAKLSAGRISPAYLLIINGIIGIAIGLYRAMPGIRGTTTPLIFTAAGLGVAILFAMGNNLGDYFYTRTFEQGAPLSIATPIILVLINIIVVAEGLLLFSETLTLARAAGFVLALSGLALLLRS